MPIATCSVCGTPLILGKRTKWCPDGSVRTNDDAGLRLVFLDTQELNNLFDVIGRQLGISAESYLQDGCREFSHRYMSLLMRLVNSQELEHYPGEESMFSLLSDYIRVWGMASPTIIEYRDHEGISLEMLNTINPTLTCGYFTGASEIIEGAAASCTWDGDNTLGHLDIMMLDEPRSMPEPSGDLVMDDAGNGNIDLPTCPECGVPTYISRMSWDTDVGLITDLINNRRMVILGADILGTTFSLVAEQLGEHILMRVVEVEREYARDIYYPHLHPSQDHLEMRDRLAALGHGDVTTIMDGEKTVFKIRHPFNPYFMAGRMLGLYEAWRNERVAASWKISEWGTAYITIYN